MSDNDEYEGLAKQLMMGNIQPSALGGLSPMGYPQTTTGTRTFWDPNIGTYASPTSNHPNSLSDMIIPLPGGKFITISQLADKLEKLEAKFEEDILLGAQAENIVLKEKIKKLEERVEQLTDKLLEK